MKKSMFSWSALTINEQKTVLSIFANDGHTIYSTGYLINNNCPTPVIKQFSMRQVSDRADPKSTISINDQPVDEMYGVYGLSVLWSLAHYYNITTDKMGRGFQAQDLTTKLRARFCYQRIQHDTN